MPHTEASLPPSPNSNQRASGTSARQNLAGFIRAWGDGDSAQIQTISGVCLPQRWQRSSGKPGSRTARQSLLAQSVTVSVAGRLCVSWGSSATFRERFPKQLVTGVAFPALWALGAEGVGVPCQAAVLAGHPSARVVQRAPRQPHSLVPCGDHLRGVPEREELVRALESDARGVDSLLR